MKDSWDGEGLILARLHAKVDLMDAAAEFDVSVAQWIAWESGEAPAAEMAACLSERFSLPSVSRS